MHSMFIGDKKSMLQPSDNINHIYESLNIFSCYLPDGMHIWQDPICLKRKDVN